MTAESAIDVYAKLVGDAGAPGGGEGVEAEIALLRGVLALRLKESPDDVAMLLKVTPLIIRGVALRYRMSPKRAQDFAEQLVAVLDSVQSQIEGS